MNATKVIKNYGYTLRKVEVELGYKDGTLRTLFARANAHEENNVSLTLLKKIADCVGCSVAEFLLDEPVTHKGKVIDHTINLPTKDLNKELGQPKLRLKEVMHEKKVSVQKIADEMGISYMWAWTMIKNGNINVDTLIKIADIIGIKVTDLFGYK